MTNRKKEQTERQTDRQSNKFQIDRKRMTQTESETEQKKRRQIERL
jgi:hypothetical protein